MLNCNCAEGINSVSNFHWTSDHRSLLTRVSSFPARLPLSRQVVAMATSGEEVDFDKVLSDLADKVGVCCGQQRFMTPATVPAQLTAAVSAV